VHTHGLGFGQRSPLDDLAIVCTLNPKYATLNKFGCLAPAPDEVDGLVVLWLFHLISPLGWYLLGTDSENTRLQYVHLYVVRDLLAPLLNLSISLSGFRQVGHGLRIIMLGASVILCPHIRTTEKMLYPKRTDESNR
jgi:hypothetical protein